MNFLLILIESITTGVLISVSIPQHVLSFLLEVIPLEIYSKNGIHLVPSLDPLVLDLNSSWMQISQRVRIWTSISRLRTVSVVSYPKLISDLGFVESFLFLLKLISEQYTIVRSLSTACSICPFREPILPSLASCSLFTLMCCHVSALEFSLALNFSWLYNSNVIADALSKTSGNCKCLF